jgi:hypothetical protein
MIETGIATVGIRVARKLFRKTRITSTTRHIAIRIVCDTSSIDSWMKVEESYATSSFIPSGTSFWSSGRASRTFAATSSVLARFCFTTPSPIACWPFHRAAVRSSSAPTSTSATSPTRTMSSPFCAITMEANPWGDASSPRVRTGNSRPSPSTRPPGISAFSVRMARSMSVEVTPRLAILWGSSQTRIAYRRSPPMKTDPTPGSRCSLSLRVSSAASVRSRPECRSLDTAIQKIGCAFTSTLATIGSSASLGSSPRTRATRSRTSFAACSTSRFSSNSIVMTEPCSRLDEVIVFTPSSVANCSSSTSVISVSTTLGLAPR